MNWLALRAVLAFLLLPGVVAFLVPWLLLPQYFVIRSGGLSLLALTPGVVLLLWCVWEFYSAGRGTLAPWSPPRHLVVTGLYRFSRNPMYIAVLLILCGWTAASRSFTIGIYTVAMAPAFHLRVVFGEEPWLARTHGVAWMRYKARVPRWLGVNRTLPQERGVD